jgi:hypothetical protein
VYRLLKPAHVLVVECKQSSASSRVQAVECKQSSASSRVQAVECLQSSACILMLAGLLLAGAW